MNRTATLVVYAKKCKNTLAVVQDVLTCYDMWMCATVKDQIDQILSKQSVMF